MTGARGPWKLWGRVIDYMQSSDCRIKSWHISCLPMLFKTSYAYAYTVVIRAGSKRSKRGMCGTDADIWRQSETKGWGSGTKGTEEERLGGKAAYERYRWLVITCCQAQQGQKMCDVASWVAYVPIYHKTGFNCECLIIANCEIFFRTQFLKSQSVLLVYMLMRKPYADTII